MTGCAPSALATATPRRPIGPGPVTTTLSPAIRPPSSVRPYIAVPAVTTSVASSSDIASETRTSVLMLLTAYSAKPPSVVNNLEVSRADRDRIDTHQHFRLLRHRHWLGAERELIGIAENPCTHGVRNWKIGRGFGFVVLVHCFLPEIVCCYSAAAGFAPP